MGKRWAKGNYCDLIPDVLFGVRLSKCCYNHDIDYWKKPITRLMADERLRICVRNKYRLAGKAKIGNPTSDLIYYFLRLFGWIRWYGIDEKILRLFKWKK